MKKLTLIFLSLLLFYCSENKKVETLDLSMLGGSYLGEPFPEEASVFLKGLTDEEHGIQNICFSSDGKEFYFVRTTLDNDSGTIFVSKNINNSWTKPEVVSFSGTYNDTDPFISHDNKKLYFASERPRPAEDDPWFDYNIWVCEREGNGWSQPRIVEYINTFEDEYHPSVSIEGNIYFSSARESSEGFWDIYKSETGEGEYLEPVRIDSPVNSKYRDWDPFISENDSLLFLVSDRPGGFGGGDIYLSRKFNGENYSEPVNLGEPVNTNEYEYCPRLSYDGKFLFFTRLEASGEDYYREKGPDTRDPFDFDFLPENGRSVVYWIAIDSLEVFKK